LLEGALADAFAKIDERRSRQQTYLQVIEYLVWSIPVVALLLFIFSLTGLLAP